MGAKFFLAFALMAIQAFGAVYYVATDGSDNAAGSKEKPLTAAGRTADASVSPAFVNCRASALPLMVAVYVSLFTVAVTSLVCVSVPGSSGVVPSAR